MATWGGTTWGGVPETAGGVTYVPIIFSANPQDSVPVITITPGDTVDLAFNFGGVMLVQDTPPESINSNSQSTQWIADNGLSIASYQAITDVSGNASVYVCRVTNGLVIGASANLTCQILTTFGRSFTRVISVLSDNQ